jgi:hypothetical protein
MKIIYKVSNISKTETVQQKKFGLSNSTANRSTLFKELLPLHDIYVPARSTVL